MKKIISLIFLVVALALAGVYVFLGQKDKTGIENPAKEVGQTQKNTIKIIAVGDSLTAGYGLRLDESYPKQLESKLAENNYAVEVINAGISGETTRGLLERVDFIKKQKPEIILITIGGNDALRGLPITETEKNISRIIELFKEDLDSKNIFLMQIKAPANLGSQYTKEFDDIYTRAASQVGVTLIPFVVPEVFTDSSLMQNDGIHPNAAGYRVLVNTYIYSAVEARVKQLAR